jgi:hypothetical protein
VGKGAQVMSAQRHKLDQAITKLRMLHEGDVAILDVIACGKPAVPALRNILFTRERSGLYQIRCRAVEALAALGATDVLIEYLETEPIISDPVERLGEDAVINAAARLLPNARDPRIFAILLRLGRHPHLTGAVGALGASGRAEAIPALVTALEDDASRAAAEASLRKFGKRARSALFNAATMQLPNGERESPSSIRRRQSALGLLADIGVTREAWTILRHLIEDRDTKVAILASDICLKCATTVERSRAVRRLIGLLVHPDWLRREDCERLLLWHYAVASGPIAAFLRARPRPDEDPAVRRQVEVALRHILARAESPSCVV